MMSRWERAARWKEIYKARLACEYAEQWKLEGPGNGHGQTATAP